MGCFQGNLNMPGDEHFFDKWQNCKLLQFYWSTYCSKGSIKYRQVGAADLQDGRIRTLEVFCNGGVMLGYGV